MEVEALAPAYSLDEAMELLGVKKSELYALMASGHLGFCQVTPRRRIIRGEQIAAFLDARTVGSPAERVPA